jgi:parallel beta-helix repeat protein
MKNIYKICRIAGVVALAFYLCLVSFLFMVFVPENASAQTIVSGNVSGTWNIGGSPYLIIDDCTVQTGTELIIEPGVVVVISDSMSLNVYGKISANGNSSQHITFKSVNNSSKFNQVYVQNGSTTPPVSEFKYCDFMNAQIGLYLHAYGRIDNAYTNMQTNVTNCNFDSSVLTALYLRAQGVDASQFMTRRTRHASINSIVDGCKFNANQVGIEMYLQGSGTSWYANGNTAAIIQNNLFVNLPGKAISMEPGAGPSHSGTPSFLNNTIINCNRGIWIQDADFNAITINNIFQSTETAIQRTGGNTNNLTTYYNCFYDNTINFTGYPQTYGSIVWTNANGDSCDLGFNIFQDPLFADTLFHLSNNSPCNNAGIDSIQNSMIWYHAPDHDISGNLRPMPVTSKPDMGAWEMAFPVSISYNQAISIATRFALSQNYPNPFNPTTNIKFDIPKKSYVKLVIYDLLGKEVTALVNEEMSAGSYQMDWNASSYPSGVYFYRIETPDFVQTRSMVLLK